MSRLRSIRDSEKEVSWWDHTLTIPETEASANHNTRNEESPTLSPPGSRRGLKRWGNGSRFLFRVAGEPLSATSPSQVLLFYKVLGSGT